MNVYFGDDYRIANPRHVPLYRYDERNDNNENGFEVFHSKKYLRRQRKLMDRRLLSKRL